MASQRAQDPPRDAKMTPRSLQRPRRTPKRAPRRPDRAPRKPKRPQYGLRGTQGGPNRGPARPITPKSLELARSAPEHQHPTMGASPGSKISFIPQVFAFQHLAACGKPRHRASAASECVQGDSTKHRRRAPGGSQKGQALSEGGGASQKPSGLLRRPS